jgi:flavin reductase (DIM6/NTAB) family NADH-FMN oxidoreductase RutF
VQNLTYRVATKSQVLAVHLVPDQAGKLAELFGGETGDDTDKFARCQWTAGPGGAPILSDLDNWFAGRVISRSDFGDHCGFLLDPIEEQARSPEATLSFHQAREIEPGHEP